MKFVNCLNKLHTTIPLECSEEDGMLQSRQLKLNPNHENYPHDAMHVYAQNVHCDEWNLQMLQNIDVSDGLTNGAMGTVTNVVIDNTTEKMSVILVAFDSEYVGQETRCSSVYNGRNQNVKGEFSQDQNQFLAQ